MTIESLLEYQTEAAVIEGALEKMDIKAFVISICVMLV